MMKLDELGDALVSSAAFAGVGVVVFAAAFWLMAKLSPFSFHKEIEEDQNISLGIIIAGVMIGLALIISAAIHG
jgi:putative membrane protein